MKGSLEIRDGVLIIRIPVSPVLKKTKLRIDDRPRLTRRETEVLRGLLQWKQNKEIATDLNLSERTIKFHVSSLLEKFGVQSRFQLTEKALREENNRDDSDSNVRGARHRER